MGKLWTFGDSFTHGHGCNPEDPYYIETYDGTQRIWTEIVAETLNLKEVNKGIKGNSPMCIIRDVIKNLQNIKIGDIVIISDTHPTRTALYSRYYKDIVPVATEILFWPQHNKGKEKYPELFFKSEEEKRNYVEYLYNCIYKHEEHWLKYYEEQFIGLLSHLNNISIPTYFWSYRKWHPKGEFKSIAFETKGRIPDGHWSWDGHKNFSEYMLTRIKNRQYNYNDPLI